LDLMAALDCHWQSIMLSEMIISRDLPKVVFKYHLSLAMEGFGVKKIMETLKLHDLNVTQVVHDKDASTMRQVMEVYQDVEEGLCLCNIIMNNNFQAHGCKNLKKQIIRLAKLHPELRLFATRASRAMRRIILQSMQNGERFKSLVQVKLDHYCGYHDNCTDKDTCKKFVHIGESNARRAFMVIIL